MTAPDLLAIVLPLQPLTPLPDRPVPRWWGRAAHALLLHVIQQADPALAKRLHDASAPRPFTTSSLIGALHRRLEAKATYRLRFTALDPALSALLREACRHGPLAPDAVVALNGFPFRVLPAVSDDPWAGQTTFEALLTAGREAAGLSQRTLRLASPTTFKSQGHHQPFPLPGWAFGSLAARWQALVPHPLPAGLGERLASGLAVSRYRLQSAVVPLKGAGRRIGAVGVVTYAGSSLSEADRAWWHTLAAFAFYAGLGVGTAMGLGQCRLVSSEEAYGHRTSHHPREQSRSR